MEDPGYQMARHTFAATGAAAVPVAVDADGLQAERLDGIAARLAYVTPSHQYPLGGVLPIGRRHHLLAWARNNDAYVIEDDYDSEYRYDTKPIPPLHALEGSDHVIYLGTVSKTLSPTLRIGYLVVPQGLRSLFAAAKQIMDRHTPLIEQEALATMLEGGAYDSHVRRAPAQRRTTDHADQRPAPSLRRPRQDRRRSRWPAFGGMVRRPAAKARGCIDQGRQCQRHRHLSCLRAVRQSKFARKSIGLVMGYAALETAQIERGCKLLAQAVAELDR